MTPEIGDFANEAAPTGKGKKKNWREKTEENREKKPKQGGERRTPQKGSWAGTKPPLLVGSCVEDDRTDG